MAEVRKKVVEDTYNTSKIKKKETKKDVKKVEKVNNNKEKNNKTKKSLFTKFMIFCHGVKMEASKVHWTSKQDMVKYSIAVILFIIFCSLFFYLIEVLFALVQSLFL